MDTDISHAVEERLAAIEARLDALDGGTTETPEVEPVEETTPVEETATTTSYSGRRSRSTSE